MCRSRHPATVCRIAGSRLASLFDRLGPEFTIIGSAADAAPLVAYARESGVPLATLGDAGLGLAEFFGAKLVLVRPDQHIAWTGASILRDEASPVLEATLRGFRTDVSTGRTP